MDETQLDPDLIGFGGTNDRVVGIYEPPELEVSEETQDSSSFTDVFKSQRDEIHLAQNLFRADRFKTLNQDSNSEFKESLGYSKIQKDIKDRGLFEQITEEDIQDIHDSNNQQAYLYRLQRIAEKQENQRELQEAGGLKAFSAQMAAYTTDPVGFAIDVASGGAARTGSLLKRFLEGGARGLFAEGLQESIRSLDETTSSEDYLAGVVASFTLGGLAGTIGKSEVDMSAFKNPSNYSTTREIAKDIDVSDTTQGSVGAMLNRDIEDLPKSYSVPENSAVEATYDLLDKKGFIEQSKLSKLSFGGGANGQRTSYLPAKFINQEILGVGIRKNTDVARELPAVDIAQMTFSSTEAPVQRAYNQHVLNYARSNYDKNIITSQFSGRIQQEFSSKVGKYMLTGSSEGVDEAVIQMAKEAHKGFKDIGQKLVDAEVIRKEQLISGDYVPRVLSYGKMLELETALGGSSKEVIKELIVKSLSSGRKSIGLEVDEKITNAVASAYVRRLTTPPSGESGFKRSDNVLGLDLSDHAYMKELLEDSDITDEALEEMMTTLDSLVKKESSSDSPRLEHRLPLDMETKIQAFTGKEITMADLFEDDFQSLFYDYNRWASGEIALKKKGLSLEVLKNLEAEVSDRVAINKKAAQSGTPRRNMPTPKDLKEIKEARRAIQGFNVKGVDPDATSARLLRALKKLSFVTKMGMSGINAVTESGTNIATAQLKNFFRDSKDLKNVMKYFSNRKIPNEFIGETIFYSNGMADTWAMNLNNIKHTADSARVQNDSLGKVEQFLEGGARVVTATSGLSHITDASRLKAAAHGLRLLDDMAMGRKMPRWWNKRSLDWTLSPERADAIKNYLSNSKNVIRDKNGRLLQSFPQDTPVNVRDFISEFIYAISTNNILNVNPTNTPKFLDRPELGAVFQFKSFVMGAWERHVLNDLKHRDYLAAKKFTTTASLGMLMYMVKVNLEHPADKKKREELLEMDKVIRSGATYAVNSVLLPDVIDTVAETVTGSPIIGRQRTSGLDSNLLAGIPAMDIANDVGHISRLPFDLARGAEMSKEQVDALFAVTMLDALWPTRALKNYFKQDLKSERRKDRKEIKWFE